MRKLVLQELLVTAVLLGAAGVVFFETRDIAVSPGQVAPGTFPRLAAGALAALALLHSIVVVRRGAYDDVDSNWNWSHIRKPLAAGALMVAYYLLFRSIPFSLLNFGFLFLVLLSFGVKPIWKVVLSAVVATVLFELLFVHLLKIQL
ncbi:MAG: tripartite tricarboxylate transporter TctB family protein [Opitutales bacterium]